MFKKRQAVVWDEAPDIKDLTEDIISKLDLPYPKENIHYTRSRFTNTRAIARIWGLSRIWQLALKLPPSYILEVISERFDRLDKREKQKVLIHELTHIPKNFSGSLIPHIRRGGRNFQKRVSLLFDHFIKFN